MAESPKRAGVLWVGGDDGLVHVSQDAGKTWQNVTPTGMPEWIQINSIDASPHDPAVAYVAATMYKSDDFRPYLYRTADYGKTWTKIVSGIAGDAFTRVVREDPNAKGVLYAGTETGVYVSFDNGDQWQSLQLNLPVVPITDLTIQAREDDLVVATQGRSFYVLDNLAALRQMHALPAESKESVVLLKPEAAYRMQGGSATHEPGSTFGANPPSGAVFHFWLHTASEKPIRIEILDVKGGLIREFESRLKGAKPDPEDSSEPKFDAKAGLNEFVWNLRYPDARRIKGMILWGGQLLGPKAVPGEYQIRLSAAGKTLTEKFTVKKDPRMATSQADFEKQFALLSQIRDKLSEIHDGILRIRDVRAQLQDFAKRQKNDSAAAEAVKAAESLAAKLTTIEEALYQTKNKSPQDPLNYPIQLNNKLAALAGVVGRSDHAPTDQSYVVHEDLVTRINAQLNGLRTALDADLARLNELVRKASLPVIRPAAVGGN
jgi:hypothetical protein